MMNSYHSKRYLLAFFLLAIFPLLCACGRYDDVVSPALKTPSITSAQSSVPNPGTVNSATHNEGTNSIEDVSVRAIYKSVLLSQIEFIDSRSGKGAKVLDLDQFYGEGVITTVPRFAVFDLDHDSIPEIVLSIYANGHLDGVLILRYQDGEIYGYGFSDRQFSELKTDGSFHVSESATEGGICTISFDARSYTIDKYLYASLENTDGTQLATFTIREEAVTEAEYDAAYEEWKSQPFVMFQEFTETNIISMLS